MSGIFSNNPADILNSTSSASGNFSNHSKPTASGASAVPHTTTTPAPVTTTTSAPTTTAEPTTTTTGSP